EIHRHRVIIRRNGRLEYLELERPDIVRSTRRKKSKTTPLAGGTGIAPIASGPPPDKFKEEGFEREGYNMVMDEKYKQQLLNEQMTDLLQNVKASPNVLPNGEVRGFKLTRIREGSIYQKAGFQNQDV